MLHIIYIYSIYINSLYTHMICCVIPMVFFLIMYSVKLHVISTTWPWHPRPPAARTWMRS